MIKRGPWMAASHIEGDDLTERCKTPGCKRQPDVIGGQLCHDCEYELAHPENDVSDPFDDGDRAYDAAKDEGLL